MATIEELRSLTESSTQSVCLTEAKEALESLLNDTEFVEKCRKDLRDAASNGKRTCVLAVETNYRIAYGLGFTPTISIYMFNEPSLTENRKVLANFMRKITTANLKSVSTYTTPPNATMYFRLEW
jgi:hypothetical protein